MKKVIEGTPDIHDNGMVIIRDVNLNSNNIINFSKNALHEVLADYKGKQVRITIEEVE